MWLRVATWNVLADTYVDAARYPRTPEHLLVAGARRTMVRDSVAGLIAALELDVVCLQEVDVALCVALAELLLAAGWRFHWSPKGPPIGDGCLTLVARRWTRCSAETRRYRSAPDNPAQRIEIGDGTSTVAVYQTHLRWAPDGETILRDQAAELADWTLRDPLPAIVAGDLNAGPDSDALRQLLAAGFRDVHPDPALWTACFDHRGPVRLDYILVRAMRARPVCATSIAPGPAMPLPNHTHPSDHLPLAAAVQVGVCEVPPTP